MRAAQIVAKAVAGRLLPVARHCLLHRAIHLVLGRRNKLAAQLHKKLRVGGKSMVQIYHAVFMSLLDDASREVEKHRSASCEGWAPQAHAGAGAAPSAHEPACTQRKTAGGALWSPLRVPPVAHRPAPHAIEQTRDPRARRAVSRPDAAQDGAESSSLAATPPWTIPGTVIF